MESEIRERPKLMSMMILPSHLEVIDQVSKNLKISRSEFMRVAAREKVEQLAKKDGGYNED